MALEKIKSERTLKALKPGAGRINDGGGLYLVPFACGESHYWRMDYTHQGRRRTMSLGAFQKSVLTMSDPWHARRVPNCSLESIR